jgi:hypothetical protein
VSMRRDKPVEVGDSAVFFGVAKARIEDKASVDVSGDAVGQV